MGTFLYSFLFFVVALSLLIAIHEFGHYWVARKVGVKVLKFSIGFGKPIWRSVRGPDQTEYILAMIPLGGYVKMLDEREEEVAENEIHRAFNRKPLLSRVAVVAAGPAFNFAFAILAYFLMFNMGVPGIKPLVGNIEQGSPFSVAGFQKGDEILSVDGDATPTLESFRLALIENVLANNSVEVNVIRVSGSQKILTLNLTETPADAITTGFLQYLGFAPLRPNLPAIIDSLLPDGAASQAGFQPGDKVIQVDDTVVEDWIGWAEYVRKRPEQSMEVLVERGPQTLTIEVTPTRIEIQSGDIGRVGASPHVPDDFFADFRSVHEYSFFSAIPAAIYKTWDMSILTLRMLWKMLVGEASLENISGPISIAQYAGQTADIGFVAFLSFLAVVSVSLGVLNLLPIPILDGGHLLYYLAEFIKGSPVSENTQLLGQKIGIIMLGGLMFLAVFNDINRLIG